MRFLRRFLRFIRVRLRRKIGAAELLADILAGFAHCFVRNARGVGAHVGDEADRPLADINAFVQFLRDGHGFLGGIAEFAGGFLLQGACRKGRDRIAPRLFFRHVMHDERGGSDIGDDRLGLFFVGDFRFFRADFEKFCVKHRRLLGG